MGSTQMRLVVLGTLDDADRARLEALAPDVKLTTGPDADALLFWGGGTDAAVAEIARQPRLRWVHQCSAGVGVAMREAAAEAGFTLTNGSGPHGPALGEFVVGALLALWKHLPAFLEAQREGRWRTDLPIAELAGKTVGIVGTGALGGAGARLLRPFGATVIGVSRSGAAMPDFDEVHRPDALPGLLPQLDALVLAAPLTAQTRDLIGAAELALLPRGALLVNISRGELLDETALIAALRSGQIGGAALDVVRDEPLAPDAELWRLPNVIITAHSVDATPETLPRSFELFVANLERALRGEPLANVVDLEQGY
jgi:phosphoglycerate dehydrogenase-like enzyme